MKEIKQKPAGGKPKTADAARVPKAVVKAAWLQAREAGAGRGKAGCWREGRSIFRCGGYWGKRRG